jgi:hypothetical protein
MAVASCTPAASILLLLVSEVAARAASVNVPILIGKWQEVSQNRSPVSPGAVICDYLANHTYTCQLADRHRQPTAR